MTSPQATLIAIAFVILFTITAAVRWKWLRPGRLKTALVLLAGVLTVGALWAAGIPPRWFSGDGSILGAFLAMNAFLIRGTEARTFGVPLLLSMGLSLIAINAAHVIAGLL
jgi:hypothetical protein